MPRFVDTYVVDHGRYGLQVHAALYRDLLSLLQREALLAASAYALEAICKGGAPNGRPQNSHQGTVGMRPLFGRSIWRRSPASSIGMWPLLWTFSQICRCTRVFFCVLSSPRRTRKAFEAANHPFVDRCAFMLDSSFLENARVAASRALASLESLTMQIIADVLGRPKHE